MSQELNLLPPERRQLLNRESFFVGIMYALRNILLGLGIVTVCGLAAGVILQGLVFMAAQSTDVQLEEELAKYRERREEIARHNAVLDRMYNLTIARRPWSQILHETFTLLPAGVVIERISGRIEQTTQLSFSGQAVNRNAVIVLSNRLESIPWVKNLEAPHANLVQRVNPNYSFTLVIDDRLEETSQ